jgi:hypothetical protein
LGGNWTFSTRLLGTVEYRGVSHDNARAWQANAPRLTSL